MVPAKCEKNQGTGVFCGMYFFESAIVSETLCGETVYTGDMARRPALSAFALLFIVCAFHLLHFLAKKGIKEPNSVADVNVHGGALKACSGTGMAATGYGRDGFCRDEAGDSGSHHMCLDIATGEANFCESTGQPNWCDEKDACQGDEKARCPRKKWCVCQWAFDKVLQRTPCSELKLDCAATNLKALEAFRRDPKKYSRALKCIGEKCAVGVGLKPD